MKNIVWMFLPRGLAMALKGGRISSHVNAGKSVFKVVSISSVSAVKSGCEFECTSTYGRIPLGWRSVGSSAVAFVKSAHCYSFGAVSASPVVC